MVKRHNSTHQWAIFPEMESKQIFHYQLQQVGSPWEPQPSHAVHFFLGFDKLAPKVENCACKKTEKS